jgi:hypothetical protein
MSDVHLRILRAAALHRARQLDALPDDDQDTPPEQRPERERRAARARRQLTMAGARRVPRKRNA